MYNFGHHGALINMLDVEPFELCLLFAFTLMYSLYTEQQNKITLMMLRICHAPNVLMWKVKFLKLILYAAEQTLLLRIIGSLVQKD